MNSHLAGGGRRKPPLFGTGGSCAPAERSVKGFSRLRRRAKRALDRPFGRRVPVTVPNNGGPWRWRSFPESLCDSNCESDALVPHEIELVDIDQPSIRNLQMRDHRQRQEGDLQE